MNSRIVRAAAALAGLTLVQVALNGSDAATPADGSVGPKRPTVTWQGQTYPAHLNQAPVVDPAGACPDAATDPANQVCDHFAFTVDVPRSYYRTHRGGVRVSLIGDSTGAFYLYVYDAAGNVAAANDDGDETVSVVIPEAAGSYEVRVAPAVAIVASYKGTVTFLGSGVAAPAEPAFAAYRAGRHAALPDKEPSNKPIRHSGPKLAFRSTYVGRDSAEPTIGVDKHGRAFYAAAAFDLLPANEVRNLPNTVILRSTDGNKTWQRANPDISGRNTHTVTFDPYVYLDKDTGRVFDIDLAFANGSYLSFSDDGGATWTKGAVISPGVNDHQTLASGPVPPESGIVTTDPKFPKILYYCINEIAGAACSRSLDGGLTFHNTGAPPYAGADQDYSEDHGIPFCGSLHGHVVADSRGRVFLPKGHCGKPWLAVSEDAGDSWTRVKVSDTIGMGDNQTSIAVDSADNLYYVWFDPAHHLPWLSVSRDAGETWSTPVMIAPPGVKEVGWPTIDAGDPGRVAILFPGTTIGDETDLTRPWNLYVAVSTNALEAQPTFVSNVANPGGPRDPVHRGDCAAGSGRCGRIYDFLDVVVAPDATGTVWGTGVDTCGAAHLCSTVRNPGYSDALAAHGVSDQRAGFAIRQVSGPVLRRHRAVSRR